MFKDTAGQPQHEINVNVSFRNLNPEPVSLQSYPNIRLYWSLKVCFADDLFLFFSTNPTQRQKIHSEFFLLTSIACACKPSYVLFLHAKQHHCSPNY